MPKPHRRDAVKEKHWRRLLRVWRGSGLTGRDFCAEHSLSEPSFYAWRREIARRDRERAARPAAQASVAAGAPAFVEVMTSTPVGSVIEVVLAQGQVLRVAPGFDADLLRRLVRVLEEPTC